MKSIKDALRGTFVYQYLLRRRVRKAAAIWTAREQEALEFYSKFVSAGELCIDVGANIGNRTRIFLKAGARVVAVEPQDECARLLSDCYGGQPGLTIVRKALGERAGQAEILISNASTISSLSREWIEAVRKSGRFSEYRWDRSQKVEVTTLDSLIQQYGMPAFIKIDVEGFEFQVLRGLSRPVKALSFEFTPEFIDATLKCIEHLQTLGDLRLNYSEGESLELALPQWVRAPEMAEIMRGLSADRKLFGDIYARFS